MPDKPKSSGTLRFLTTPLAAFLCAGADFWSKRWAEQNLIPHERVPFIPQLLNLNLTTNTGAAFSIGKDSSTVMTFLASLVTVILIAWYISREKDKIKPDFLERTGIGFILGGALGNLLDRFSKGCVTDFLDFAFIDFPVFNVADAMIDVGIGLVLISMLRQRPEAKEDSGVES